MFSQAWFWLFVAAVFFTLNTESFSTNTKFPGSGVMGGLSVMGIIVWFILALIFSDHWWYPIVALILGVVASPFPAMISRHLNTFFGMAGMVVAPLCIIVGYVVWF